MTPLFQTGPEGTTIHHPPFPTGLGAVLWLAGFMLALVLFLTLLKRWKHRREWLARAGPLGERIGNLGRRFYLAILIPAGLAAMAWAAYAYLHLIPPLISELLARLGSTLAAPSWGVSSAEEVRNYAYAFAALAGSLAFLATVPFQLARVWINERNARNAEENLTTDLINKAVEGLGAEKTEKKRGSEETRPNIEVRIGAIYQLERIAHNQAHSGTDQGARDHIRIMEILCAYIRQNAPARSAVDLNMADWPDYPENPTAEDLEERARWRKARRAELKSKISQLCANHKPRTDIQTALSVIGRRDASQIAIERRAIRPGQEKGYRLDLRGTCLQAADLAHLDLDLADLSEARLEGAILYEARLEGADLSEARLEGANLYRARLERAHHSEARLEGAILCRARLEWADLSEARLEGADLSEARLKGARLYEARLEGADLYEAWLERAELSGARLEGAFLVWATLRRANWAGGTNNGCPAQFADLRGGEGLDQSRLSSLVGNAATLLPDDPPGLYVPHKWATEPPGFDRLLANPARYGFWDADALRAALVCGPGEVPMKTGTPWPLNAPPPWGAQTEGEYEWEYQQRVEAWAAAQPLRGPVD